MKRNKILVIISILIVLGFCVSCGKSGIEGNWSVSVNNSEYIISVDEDGMIHKENELIGVVSEDSKTIELSIQEDGDNEDGGGHYINRIILDGKEYFYDWYNGHGFPKIMTKSEAEKVVTFYDGQYEYTGKLLEQWQ